MGKKTILLIACMLVSIGFLSGCNQSNNSKEKLIGVWRDYSTGVAGNTTWTFTENTFTHSGNNRVYQYEIVNKDGKEFIYVPDGGINNTAEYFQMYWINDKTLKIEWVLEDLSKTITFTLKKE